MLFVLGKFNSMLNIIVCSRHINKYMQKKEFIFRNSKKLQVSTLKQHFLNEQFCIVWNKKLQEFNIRKHFRGFFSYNYEMLFLRLLRSIWHNFCAIVTSFLLTRNLCGKMNNFKNIWGNLISVTNF